MKINKELLSYLKLFGVLFMVFAVLIGGIVGFEAITNDNDNGSFRTFKSCSNMANYINTKRDNSYSPYGEQIFEFRGMDDFIEERSVTEPNSAIDQEEGVGDGGDYSKTNNQVDGVDESDVLKTDGEHAFYIVDNEVVIFDISNAAEPEEIERLDFESNPEKLFLQDDTLVVQLQSIYYQNSFDNNRNETLNAVHVLMYDISDIEDPEFLREVIMQGDFKESRKIDNYTYIITTNSYYQNTDLDSEDAKEYIPRIALRENKGDEVDSVLAADCNEISYFGDSINSFVNVTAINLDTSEASSKVMLGDSSNLYMSSDNLYLSSLKTLDEEGEPIDWDDVINQDPNSLTQDFAPLNYNNFTEIIKLSIDGTNIDFKASGIVEGTLLNQFSFDEFEGNLRVATTSGDFWGWGRDSENNLYVLDENMDQVGSIEGLAEGERIKSTRFMGEMAYVVTFREIDPLFAIDFSDPRNPKVLGELKLPGYSDYLHPYDENHLIGIGYYVDPDGVGITDGIQVNLFDITDPVEPKVLDQIILGEEGSRSDVTSDHKAFLFDKDREIIVMPVILWDEGSYVWDYSNPEFKGFVVLNINLEEGISEAGRIAHDDNPYYLIGGRSMYVDSTLLTFSPTELVSTDIETLEENSRLEL